MNPAIHHPTIGVFYASTSGRTRRAAEQIVAQIVASGHSPAIELFQLKPECYIQLSRFDILVWGSPTYGQGDMHHAWQALACESVLPALRAKAIHCFALGDRRHHGKTFGQALPKLRVLADRCLDESYQQPKSQFACSPTSDLLLDYIADRHKAAIKLASWCEQFVCCDV